VRTTIRLCPLFCPVCGKHTQGQLTEGEVRKGARVLCLECGAVLVVRLKVDKGGK